MLRRHHRLWRTVFAVVDVTLSLGAFLAAYLLRFHPAVTAHFPLQAPIPPLTQYVRILPVLALILLISNTSLRLYAPRREGPLATELADILKATVLTLVILTAFLFFERSQSYARGIIGIFAVLNPAAAFALRASIRGTLRYARRRGFNLRHALLIGTGRAAQALIHRIRRNPWTGLRIVGLIGDRAEPLGRLIHGVPVVGTLDRLEEVLVKHPADQVFIALPPHRAGEVESLVSTLSQKLIDIRIVPDLGVLLSLNYQTVDFDGLPIVSLWESPISGWSAVGKRVMDFVLALAGIVVLAPFLGLIALLVKCSSRGPVLYRQERMGLDGRLFSMLKFRTMDHGVGPEVGPRVGHGAAQGEEAGWTRPNDPRCTGLGRLLRRTSLDELPQLFNVLAGQMSLVGPRPERPVFIEKFRRSVPLYMLRHKVKAGMTGWAQVNGWRGNTSLKKRIQYDLYYLEHWSLLFDVKILAMTVVRGLVHPNAY